MILILRQISLIVLLSLVVSAHFSRAAQTEVKPGLIAVEAESFSLSNLGTSVSNIAWNTVNGPSTTSQNLAITATSNITNAAAATNAPGPLATWSISPTAGTYNFWVRVLGNNSNSRIYVRINGANITPNGLGLPTTPSSWVWLGNYNGAAMQYTFAAGVQTVEIYTMTSDISVDCLLFAKDARFAPTYDLSDAILKYQNSPYVSPISITTTFKNLRGIAYSETLGKIVVGVNYPTGLPHALEYINFLGEMQQYSIAKNITGEVKFSSTNELYYVPGTDGVITRFADSGMTYNKNWCRLGTSVGLVTNLFEDTIGVWNYSVIATTDKGKVLVIGFNDTDPNVCGQVRVVADANNNTGAESIITVPDNASQWGDLAGKILVAERGVLRAIGTDGSVKTYPVPFTFHDMDLIEKNMNYFALAIGVGKLVGVQDTVLAPYIGSIMVMQEKPVAGDSGLAILSWDSVSQSPVVSKFQYARDSIANTVWNKGVMAPVGINEMVPPHWAVCQKMYDDAYNELATVSPVSIPTSAVSFYGYNTTVPYSTALSSLQESDTLVIIMTRDPTNKFSLIAIADQASDNTGGSVTMIISSSGAGFPVPIVQDDPHVGGNYEDKGDDWATTVGDVTVTLNWGPTTSDGVVFASINYYDIMALATPDVLVQVNNKICSDDTGFCGDGEVYEPLEQCDGGGCCTSNCFLKEWMTTCRAKAGPCDKPEYCDGESPECPADVFQPTNVRCRTASGVCDNSDYCNGTSAVCPPSPTKLTSLCRASKSACDAPEYCDGVHTWCPTDVNYPNGRLCNNTNSCYSNNTCSVGVCTGIDTYCVGVCGDGIVASQEQCDPPGPCCDSNCRFKSSTSVCRSAAGVCDAVEYCSGSSSICPVDAKLNSVCRAENGYCDPAEVCNGVNNDCPVDIKRNANETCTPSNACMVDGACVAGVCTGIDRLCEGVCGDNIVAQNEDCDPPGDCCSSSCKFLPSSTECRSSKGACDVAEYCSGDKSACPSDLKSTSECRASTGVCDPAETCNGVDNACPKDSFVANGTSCVSDNNCLQNTACSAGVCTGTVKISCTCGNGQLDNGEQCDPGLGLGVDDPNDCCTASCQFEASTEVCRGSTGPCDAVEYCTGHSAACPVNKYQNGTVCREADGDCDVAETCNGVSVSCPSNSFEQDGTSCSSTNPCSGGKGQCSAGVCVGIDIYCGGICGDNITAAAEDCDPPGDCCDANCKFVAPTVVCRNSKGDCDVAETCTGSSSSCPADVKRSNTYVCRAAFGECDVVEKCSGVSDNCPTDARKVSNETCNAGPCTQTGHCVSGACVGVDVYCNGTCGDGIVSSTEQCDNGSVNDPCCVNCKLSSSQVVCRASTGLCDPAEYCNGGSTCPADVNGLCPVCSNNCSGHGQCVANGVCTCDHGYSGEDCSIASCELWTDCGSCNTHSGCGWCCSSGLCVPGNATGPIGGTCDAYTPQSCNCKKECKNGGTCSCGTCSCPAGYTGDDCNKKVDCEGQEISTVNIFGKVIDVCNVCGGNGTLCIGCDGIPYGKQYDKCGVCGGDGSSCYSLCAYTDCDTCAKADGCGWCKSKKTCLSAVNFNKCSSGSGALVRYGEKCTGSSNVLDVLNAQTAGIGAGVLAAVVIAVIVGIVVAGAGGKKGYDLYKAAREQKEQDVFNNPLFEEKDMEAVNPIYEHEITPIDE